MSPDTPPPVELALAARVRLRLLGTGLVAIGVVVAAGVALTEAGASAVGAGLVVLAAVGLLVLGFLVGVRRWVLRLDEHGYRVRGLRVDARAARWSDVLDLQAVHVGRTRAIVLRLRDGRTTALPVDSIEGGPTRLTEQLTHRLDRTHGYRRLT